MRTIFIGDVHGCREELAELLQEVQFGTPCEDRVIFVGDLVDKGPDSLGVLRDVQRILRTFPGSVVVSGNHEEKASRQWKRGTAVEPWCEEATEADWAFIDAMPLVWWDGIRAPLALGGEGGIRVVHGGIFPRLTELHPDVWHKIEARGDKWRKGGGKVMNRARRMLRVRYVGNQYREEEKMRGAMIALNENVAGDPFWADTYDGKHGFVIYGHSPWLSGDVRRSSYALGIDTACVFGGKLTAAVVDNESGEIELVSVDAHKQYAVPMKED